MSANVSWTPLPSAEPLISIRGLRKYFARGLVRAAPRTCALYDVDLDLEAGEVVVLFGSEGAGKTTLLQCACGLLRADAGCVRWSGESFAGGGCHPDAAYVSAVPVFYPFLTVDDVLSLRMSRDAAHERCDESLLSFAVAAVELDDMRRNAVASLSRDEIKRLAIAEAFVSSPKAMLVDTAASDAIPARVVSRVAEHGIAVVIAVRDCAGVAPAASRLIHLDSGQVGRAFSSERQLMFVAERVH